jgi:hypothetical protein
MPTVFIFFGFIEAIIEENTEVIIERWKSYFNK